METWMKGLKVSANCREGYKIFESYEKMFWWCINLKEVWKKREKIDPSSDFTHGMTWMWMHVIFCSPEEPAPLLFLDRLVPFKANEQLQRCLKSTGGSSWKSFFLHSSTHNQHFFPSPLLISSPFPFLKTSREVSHLGGPCSNYRKFSLPEDV